DVGGDVVDRQREGVARALDEGARERLPGRERGLGVDDVAQRLQAVLRRRRLADAVVPAVSADSLGEGLAGEDGDEVGLAEAGDQREAGKPEQRFARSLADE